MDLAAGLFEVLDMTDLRSNTASPKSNPRELSTTDQAIKAACECVHCSCYQLGGTCCYCERKLGSSCGVG